MTLMHIVALLSEISAVLTEQAVGIPVSQGIVCQSLLFRVFEEITPAVFAPTPRCTIVLRVKLISKINSVKNLSLELVLGSICWETRQRITLLTK